MPTTALSDAHKETQWERGDFQVYAHTNDRAMLLVHEARCDDMETATDIAGIYASRGYVAIVNRYEYDETASRLGVIGAYRPVQLHRPDGTVEPIVRKPAKLPAMPIEHHDNPGPAWRSAKAAMRSFDAQL